MVPSSVRDLRWPAVPLIDGVGAFLKVLLAGDRMNTQAGLSTSGIIAEADRRFSGIAWRNPMLGATVVAGVVSCENDGWQGGGRPAAGGLLLGAPFFLVAAARRSSVPGGDVRLAVLRGVTVVSIDLSARLAFLLVVTVAWVLLRVRLQGGAFVPLGWRMTISVVVTAGLRRPHSRQGVPLAGLG